jgi:hypothetical protein
MMEHTCVDFITAAFKIVERTNRLVSHPQTCLFHWSKFDKSGQIACLIYAA